MSNGSANLISIDGDFDFKTCLWFIVFAHLGFVFSDGIVSDSCSLRRQFLPLVCDT